ncbi:MAG: SufE family protein [Anaerolineales bacterium]|nr:SufE family protein [Anaerolineales bacterium]MCB0004845.1 SufE family protein [Anaerolineales bacterium]MCB0014268.1 SufE family protein [Anaerolineales bacterium]MCB0020159.1 SufE family protein [Anaerolineales bacterium]MCB8959504.1 SufE family protein [Ardenticatenales bacterium]
MSESSGKLTARLQEIVEDFGYVSGREKLEYLLEFADALPALPDHLAGKRDEMDEVHECMTPVFIYLENDDDGKLRFHFDIPPESPTVRGFAEILRSGLNGATPAELLDIPDLFYLDLGLGQVLTGQRLNGIGAILAHMKQLVRDKYG